MNVFRVEDIVFEDILDKEYDLAIFASGYEERGSHIIQRLSKINPKKAIVFGFKELKDDPRRIYNNMIFGEKFGLRTIQISGDNELVIYDVLRQLDFKNRRTLKILVDYSSMSRLWYAAFLNWARYGTNANSIEIDFVYAVGEHKDECSPIVIKEILAIPGCEGGAAVMSKSVAVFGLGFDGWAPLCILDQLEPDIVFCFYAKPAAFEDYPERAINANKELIEKHSANRTPLGLPLSSVEITYRHLSEIIIPYINKSEITFVAMGPKPHILASLLISFRFGNINCLRVSGKRTAPELVGTTGQVVCTRVEIR